MLDPTSYTACPLGDGVEREVLGVSSVVVSVQGNDYVCEEAVDCQCYYGGQEDNLKEFNVSLECEVVVVSIWCTLRTSKKPMLARSIV